MATEKKATTTYEGLLIGHSDVITSIVCGNSSSDVTDNVLVSGSRDKSLIIWDMNNGSEHECGVPYKKLTGHNHFVSDLTISNDSYYVISSSWDKTLRLWDIRYGKCLERFVGHAKEVQSVCFSSDNRQIFSAGTERSIRIWNTLGECKVKSNHDNHTNWVSKVRYSKSAKNNYYASVGRDGRLKIWNGIFKLHASIKAHNNYINALAISTNGQYIATGGKDKTVKIWDYSSLSAPHKEYKTESEINDLCFNAKMRWIAVALDTMVVVYDLKSKENIKLFDLVPAAKPGQPEGTKAPRCTCVQWSTNSDKLFIGCSDGTIRVYSIDVQ